MHKQRKAENAHASRCSNHSVFSAKKTGTRLGAAEKEMILAENLFPLHKILNKLSRVFCGTRFAVLESLRIFHQKNRHPFGCLFFWRRRRDSNSRTHLWVTRFPVVRARPTTRLLRALLLTTFDIISRYFGFVNIQNKKIKVFFKKVLTSYIRCVIITKSAKDSRSIT